MRTFYFLYKFKYLKFENVANSKALATSIIAHNFI